MSLNDDKFNKTDIRLIVMLVFSTLFAGIVGVIFVLGDYDIKVAGNVDPNTLLVTFVSIVMAVMFTLGIKKNEST